MNKGDIVLARLQMSNSSFKLRPVLIINFFLPYNDCLVCGISSQLHQHAEGVSYLLPEDAGYFNKTGLLKSSVVRMNYLAMIPVNMIAGRIGFIPDALYQKIRNSLIQLIQK